MFSYGANAGLRQQQQECVHSYVLSLKLLNVTVS